MKGIPLGSALCLGGAGGPRREARLSAETRVRVRRAPETKPGSRRAWFSPEFTVSPETPLPRTSWVFAAYRAFPSSHPSPPPVAAGPTPSVVPSWS